MTNLINQTVFVNKGNELFTARCGIKGHITWFLFICKRNIFGKFSIPT